MKETKAVREALEKADSEGRVTTQSARRNHVIVGEDSLDRLANVPVLRKAPKRPKYGNVKTNGFDSKKEAARWEVLSAMQRSGLISNLLKQVMYNIYVGGIHICDYIADFVYTDAEGKRIVEDVKSPITRKNPVYRLKKKLMLAVHGIDIKEV